MMRDAHPDPNCDAHLQRIVVGELEQAIGRGRGVMRTAKNPVTIWLLTDVPMPYLSIDEEILAGSLLADSDPVVMQLATSGIAVDNRGHMAAIYPELWPTLDAAKKAKVVGSWCQSRIGNIYENSTNFSKFQYRPTGQGHKWSTCWYRNHLKPEYVFSWVSQRLNAEVTICSFEQSPSDEA
jgi:putative DNA primase/helicase